MVKLLRGIDAAIDKIADIVVLLILLIGLYFIYDGIFVFQKSNLDYVSDYKPTQDNPNTLSAISEECVAWITIYGTTIDYPIMQGEDNIEYLNKDPYGAYSLSGSIFLDSRNDKNFSDNYSLLYGHHMSAGHMFGALDAFENKDYFASHRDGELVVNGKFYQIQTFAYANTDATEGIIFNPDREGNRMEWIEKNVTLLEKPRGSRIVALSTCESPTSTERKILFVSILD